MATSALQPRRGVWRVALDLALRRRPEDAARSELRRRLRVLDLTVIGIGASVGSGIFVTFGQAVHPTGPAVCISFLIAAAGSILSALCYAEIAARIPVSGSAYLYAYTAFGELFGLVSGLNLLIDFHIGAALGALSCAEYMRTMLEGSVLSSVVPSAQFLASLIFMAVTVVLVMGVDKGMRQANGLLVALKVFIVLLIIVVGSGRMHAENLAPFAPFGLAPVASTSALCCFSYTGFGAVSSAAEECVNPQRDLPMAIIISLLCCALLYVAFSIVLCGVVPFREISISAPVAMAFGPRYGNVPWIGTFVDWGAVLGILTTLLTGLYSQARIYLAMSRDGLVAKAFHYVSPALGTPVVAQVFCGAVCIVLSACLPLDRLVRFLNIGVLASYSIVSAGVLVLRADRPSRAAGCAAALSVGSVAVSALAGALLEGRGGEARLWGLLACALLALLTAAPAWELFCLRYAAPTTFACPLCPLLPMLGVSVNGYLLAQCHWEAWLRLGLVVLAVLVGYAVRAQRLVSSGSGDGSLAGTAPGCTS